MIKKKLQATQWKTIYFPAFLWHWIESFVFNTEKKRAKLLRNKKLIMRCHVQTLVACLLIQVLGLVHTMPDKFENATLLLRIRLPSTLIRIKRSTKTELFENALQSGTIWKRYFFVLVWTENFLYPQLFEYADIILSCNLSSQVEWQERTS